MSAADVINAIETSRDIVSIWDPKVQPCEIPVSVVAQKGFWGDRGDERDQEVVLIEVRSAWVRLTFVWMAGKISPVNSNGDFGQEWTPCKPNEVIPLLGGALARL